MKIKLLITFCIAVLLLAACSKDDDDTLDFPATFNYSSIADQSEIKVYSKTAEITSGDLTSWTSDDIFSELGEEVDFDRIVIENATTARIEYTPDPTDNATGTYTVSGDTYTFTMPILAGLQAIITAELDGDKLKVANSAYVYGNDNFTYSGSGLILQTVADFQAEMEATDTLAYQEYNMVYTQQ